MDGFVMVLSGPPGAGKSTVAKLVADRLSPSVHLHTDDFYDYIRQGAVAPYLPGADHQNEVVVGVAATAAFGYAAGGYQVIADGVFGPWFLRPFRAAARAAGIPLHYVVLRPDEQSTLLRAAARTGAGALRDPGPIRSMHHHFSQMADLEPHAIDSTTQTSEETAEAVLAAIHAGQHLVR